MKKRFFALFILAAMLLAVPAYAAVSRTISIVPDIVFDGTVATCTAQIAGDRLTDSVSATMTLKRGNRVIDSWSGSGSGYLIMSETATVSRWLTYTLVVEATVNGRTLDPFSIERTNN